MWFCFHLAWLSPPYPFHPPHHFHLQLTHCNSFVDSHSHHLHTHISVYVGARVPVSVCVCVSHPSAFLFQHTSESEPQKKRRTDHQRGSSPLSLSLSLCREPCRTACPAMELLALFGVVEHWWFWGEFGVWCVSVKDQLSEPHNVNRWRLDRSWWKLFPHWLTNRTFCVCVCLCVCVCFCAYVCVCVCVYLCVWGSRRE